MFYDSLNYKSPEKNVIELINYYAVNFTVVIICSRYIIIHDMHFTYMESLKWKIHTFILFAKCCEKSN